MANGRNGCSVAAFSPPRWGFSDAEVTTLSVVKIIELVGESPNGWEDAMKQVIQEAQQTLRGITRIGVVEQDVRMINDRIDVWRVRAQVSFRVERPAATK